MSRVIWMFSGQGAQYFDMGRDLYDADAEFRDILQGCDAQCVRLLGYSLLEVIYPRVRRPLTEDFDELRNTHPALFVVQYSLAQMLLRRGMKPDLVLGYSLGEWVALAVAGAMPFGVALECIVRQTELLLSGTPPGAMLAVMGPTEMAQTVPVFRDVAVAGVNFSKHFVVSGLRDNVVRVQAYLRAEGTPHQLLPVHVGFHSPCVDGVEGAYRALVGGLSMRRGAFPVVSLSHTAVVDEVASPADYFWHVLRRPVSFAEGIRMLEPGGPYAYVDLGPSGTLATFVKYVVRPEERAAIYPILTPFKQAIQNLEKLEAAL